MTIKREFDSNGLFQSQGKSNLYKEIVVEPANEVDFKQDLDQIMFLNNQLEFLKPTVREEFVEVRDLPTDDFDIEDVNKHNKLVKRQAIDAEKSELENLYNGKSGRNERFKDFSRTMKKGLFDGLKRQQTKQSAKDFERQAKPVKPSSTINVARLDVQSEPILQIEQDCVAVVDVASSTAVEPRAKFTNRVGKVRSQNFVEVRYTKFKVLTFGIIAMLCLSMIIWALFAINNVVGGQVNEDSTVLNTAVVQLKAKAEQDLSKLGNLTNLGIDNFLQCDVL